MATKAKDPIIHAEEQVGAMQAILKDWIAKNPANAELQAFKDMKPGQWDNRTNEAFTRWVIATQAAHNKDAPNDKIKVDGWAGSETLRVLGSDPKTAEVLKNLQDAGLDRFHHRTDAHPAKGQEVAPEVAAKIPAPGTLGGAAGNPPASKAAQTLTSPSDSNKPTDHTPTTSESIAPKIVGAVAGTAALGAGALALKNHYNAQSTMPKTPALAAPEAKAVPRLSAPAPAEPAAVPRIAAPSASAPSAAAPKTLSGELMPKGSLPGAGEKLVTVGAAANPASAVGSVGGGYGAAANEANFVAKPSFLRSAWNFVSKTARGLGYASLAVDPVVAIASTEGGVGDKALAAGKSMLTTDYLLGTGIVLGSAPVSVPAATGLVLKKAWEQGLEDNKERAALLDEKTKPHLDDQTSAIQGIRSQSPSFAVELATLNDSKPYTSDRDAAKLLQNEAFFQKVQNHYQAKFNADNAAGRTADAKEAKAALEGLEQFKNSETQRTLVVREHEGPLKAASDPKQQAIPVYDMLQM